MTTEWFVNDGSGISAHAEDERLLLIGNQVPDWVRTPPNTPEIGAHTFKVTEVKPGDCVKCKKFKVNQLILEDRYRVAYCPACKFVWYRMQE